MISFEDLQLNAFLRGILPDCLASVVGVQWLGSQALKRTHEDARGRVANQSWPEITRLVRESGTRRAERTMLFGGGKA